MSFTFGKQTIACKVEFKAEGDLGEDVDASFVITYKRPSVKEGKAFGKLFATFAQSLSEMTDESTPITERTEKINKQEQELSDFVRERITGWDQVHGEDGEPMSFSDGGLLALFDDRDARRAVFARYQELVNGRKAAAVKNSEEQVLAG